MSINPCIAALLKLSREWHVFTATSKVNHLCKASNASCSQLVNKAIIHLFMSIPHGEDPKYQTMAMEEMFVCLLIKSDSTASHYIALNFQPGIRRKPWTSTFKTPTIPNMILKLISINKFSIMMQDKFLWCVLREIHCGWQNSGSVKGSWNVRKRINN